MLSTSNYLARRFGVRAGMPGFIAKKLCPQLRIVPCNFKKYTAASKVIQDIIKKYDPNTKMHMDEGSLDLTEYLIKKHPGGQICPSTAYSLVAAIRKEIHETTGLTASAGLSFH